MWDRKEMNNFIVLYVVQKIQSTQVITGTLHAKITTEISTPGFPGTFCLMQAKIK